MSLAGCTRLASRLLLALLPLVLTACGTSEVLPPLIPNQVSVTQPLVVPEYRIQPGDQLEIKFYYNRELDDLVTVRPDGRITLQLVNELMAAGFSTSELTAVLKEKYAKEIANPEIAVIVRTFEGHKIFVDGEVNRPGVYPLPGKLSMLQAISTAGGARVGAKLQDVVLIRRHGNKPTILTVNILAAIKGDLEQDFQLEPYDVVYVPKTPISAIDEWVHDYIQKVVPFSFAFSLDITP